LALGRRQRATPWLIAATAFAASALVGHLTGVAFDAGTLHYFWQYLDERILRDDLLRGVAQLHSQPPLFNLFLGTVLQLFPSRAPDVFAALWAAMRLGLLAAMAVLLLRFGVAAWLTTLLLVGFATHPNFVVYGNWLFYSLPVAFLLTVSAVTLVRYCDTGSPATAHLFTWLAGAVVLTRTAFHGVWLLAAVATVATLLPPARRRVLLYACVAPLLAVALWYGKVWWQSGFYGPSSWVGMNLAKGWDLPPERLNDLVAAGTLPEVWARGPFLWPAWYTEFGYFQQADDASGPGHPAVGKLYKSTGYPNFNHLEYARLSRDMLEADLALIRSHPRLYLDRVRRAVEQFVQPGPTLFLVTYDANAIRRASVAVGAVLPPGLIAVGLPVLLLWGIGRALGRGDDPTAIRVAVAYETVTVLWLTVSANLLEVGENDRIRWEVDCFITVLLGYGVWSAWTAFRKSPPVVSEVPTTRDEARHGA
jgi:hypothetical protein